MQVCELSHWRARLLGTFRRNPHLIISQYRAIASLDADEPLPDSLTVNAMIESILGNEEADSLSSGVLRAIAG